ncbi:MAG: UDP-2,3-diacylglucosamine hydrolase [Gammaproteobacteria bacterium]|jgi:UDP-2,3-diacylglucosamine hydrolase
MTTLFISDLHLDPARPDVTRAFFEFLRKDAVNADKLYILGDLFESWIGDDDNTDLSRSVIQALRELSLLKTPVYLQHGNRDFLLGPDFFSQSLCINLTDPTIIDLYGKSVLLMHGDSLCTEDRDYIKFRSMVRDPNWQREFLEQPLEKRRIVAQQIRNASKDANSNKSQDIMDVSPNDVTRAFNEQKVDLMIHGHTHRPFVHKQMVDDKSTTRVVLGDWEDYAWVFRYLPDHSYNLDKYRLNTQHNKG